MKLSFKKLVFVLVILFLTISTLSLNNVIANDNDSIKETEESFEKLEEQNVFTVKFNSNSENQIDAQEVAGNQKIKQPIELIKRGYSFKGWFIDENFTTRWNFEQDVVTENLTLYAKWEVQEFVITFKDYDGTELSNQTIEYGKGAVAPKDPIREKYNFIGWDKDFTNVTTDLIIKAKYELNEFVRLNNLSITGDYYTKARLTISADGTSTNGVLYQYWVKDLEENRWKMIKDYSESKSATWVPGKAGDYLYGVHIKDKNSGERLDTHLYKDITINKLPKAELNNFSITGDYYTKARLTMSADGTSTNGVLYQYWVKNLEENRWEMIKDYSESKSVTWVPGKAGDYLYGVHIKDKYSDERLDTFEYNNIIIDTKPTEIKEVIIEGTNYTNSKLTITASGTSENGVLYQFWRKDKSTGNWKMLKDYSEENSATWIPEKSGNYLYGVHVKDKKSQKRLDTFNYNNISIEKLPKAIFKDLNIEGSGNNKSAHKITANGNSINGVLYQFWAKDKLTGNWKMLKDYSEENSATWIPEKSGDYLYGVHVKDKNSSERLDNFHYKNIIIKKIDTKIKELNIEQYQPGRYTIKSEGISDNNTLYQYWVKDLSTNIWTMIKDYSTSKSTDWIPRKKGTYLYGVHIKDSSSSNRLDDFNYKRVTVTEILKTTILDLSVKGTSNINNTHTITANGVSPNGVLYQYWIKDKSIGKWSMIKDYSTSKYANWIPKKAGNYLYGVHIKDKNSGERLDTHLYKDITIKGPLIGRTIMLDPGHGGYDPGAVNNTLGIKEKDYNNALSMKIREKLISLGANVTFTRNPWEDKYIHLHDRTPIVNEAKPDIMISIHHDSSTNKNASGMSVHYSSYRPGLDTSNAYVLYKGKEYKFVREIKDWLDPIRKTRDPGIVYLDNGKEKIVNIKDVMVYDNRNPQDVAIESEKLAESLYSSLGKLNYNKYYSYIKDHNLHMTRWSNVPSALIEAGFISNNEEAKRINKPEERNKIAQTIVDAIVSYFN
ncbi:N-acetylmuramoyl-L-alanine amidase [Senegalia massiliensis]|uniref:N-acetylmuramoyl-L-alanine amidase n=1 Tax=Senegalia massiliensis TaxID=1720316 RepID=UPI0010303693|nr:N-acetylmuramoyl-L-alanine amidase [Senegalia massiliensis]